MRISGSYANLLKSFRLLIVAILSTNYFIVWIRSNLQLYLIYYYKYFLENSMSSTTLLQLILLINNSSHKYFSLYNRY
jgi:hypothetical protein